MEMTVKTTTATIRVIKSKLKIRLFTKHLKIISIFKDKEPFRISKIKIKSNNSTTSSSSSTVSTHSSSNSVDTSSSKNNIMQNIATTNGDCNYASMVSNSTPSISLWIGNVDPDVTESTLSQLFGVYGQLTNVRCLPEKYCAFVNFKHKEEAARAMQNLQVSTFLTHFLV
jgi:RNA recognition motif-containing protein